MTPDEIARRVVADGVAPVCAAGWAALGERWISEVGGATGHFFDLASVTKPMTAVALARAGIDPLAKLGSLLAEARGTASEGVPIDLLLAHRAGLEPHRSLYEPLLRGGTVDAASALRTAAASRRPEMHGDPPAEGFPPLYSDLGYVLAGAALARITGTQDAGEAIARYVLGPLGQTSRAGTVRDLASKSIRGPFVPTEDVAWRGGRIEGAVHDENAWALTGHGGSGHAGIFATLDAVLAFGIAVIDAFQDRAGPLGDADVKRLVRKRPGGTQRAGFDGKSAQGSTAGARMSPRAFGHLGFVGTSLWIDPDARIVVSLLTNRVFYGRDPVAIRSARPWAHDALWERAREMSPRYRRPSTAVAPKD